MIKEMSKMGEADHSESTNETIVDLCSIKLRSPAKVLNKRTIASRFEDKRDLIQKAWDNVTTKR